MATVTPATIVTIATTVTRAEGALSSMMRSPKSYTTGYPQGIKFRRMCASRSAISGLATLKILIR